MPKIVDRDGIRWVRPWLEQPREAIDAYVRMHRLGHIDDASNADPQFARSRLRHRVMPALRAAFPDAEQALASAAAQAARARALIDEVAKSDLAAVCDGAALVLQRWHALSPVRRRECLRAWLAPLARSGVGDALLDRLDAELPGTKPARWPFDGVELRRYRGTITATAVPPPACAPTWPCRAEIDRVGIHKVPGSKSTLHVRKVRSDGVALALLREACWQTRRGAERFQRAHGTPARSLKKQFQAAGIPAWSRDAPLLYGANGQLIFVPGLGTDARALAEPGQPRVTLTWEPET
jgi:tRNA(Ile)-lysidine synthase